MRILHSGSEAKTERIPETVVFDVDVVFSKAGSKFIAIQHLQLVASSSKAP